MVEGGAIVTVTLYQGDCLEIMKTLPDASVHAIITDLPYGTTACAWDEVIPFAPMWEQVKRVLKPRGVFVTTASQPFTSALVMSNLDWFKYVWVWDKNRGNGHLIARFRPLQQTEDVVVFCEGGTVYNPVMVKRQMPRKFGGSPSQSQLTSKQSFSEHYRREDYLERFPTNLLTFPWANRDGTHPTQKPVALYAYLIRTYTNPGDVVADIAMGSGTTGVAAAKEGRGFVGIELDETYFKVAEKRIEQAQLQMPLLEAAG